MDTYHLKKPIWDDSDFSVMGWHDATIWSMLPDPEAYEFSLDLDYIFEWVPIGAGERYFKFWVAPTTMVFENAHTVRIDIDSSHGAMEVAELHRGEPKLTPNGKLIQRSYRFVCQEGSLSLMSTGFHMFVRRTPELLSGQSFGLAERGGIGFQRGYSGA